MDLPIRPTIDKYQIQKTPFFRRLHQNDAEQFERLKRAYESVRSFDDKPLDIKVKKVRLEKLVQRIKDSLRTAQSVTRKKPRSTPKSQHQVRCEELDKARRMGIQYSRNNYNISTSKFSENKIFIPKEELLKKTFQLNRRLDYGKKISLINRSKIQRNQAMYWTDGEEFCFSSAPMSALGEKLRKSLVHYLSEDEPDPAVVNGIEKIAETKNHLYWDLVGAIRKQQQNIKRYSKFTKRLFKFTPKNINQYQRKSHEEVFRSKTNIRPRSSEVLIRTYRYSDEDEYLPPPSESLLHIPSGLSDDVAYEIPTRDEFDKSIEQLKDSNSVIKHCRIAFPNLPSNKIIPFVQNVNETKLDSSSQKFGDIIRQAVRKESALLLSNLEKAMRD